MVTDDALVLLAWDAVTDDAALARLLENLAAAFGCRSAALVYKDRASPAADIAVAYGPFADPEVQRIYATQYAAYDPAPAALARLSVGEVAETETLFPLHERERFSVFLRDFYYPLGLAGALGAPLCKDETRIGMVAIHREASRAPFDQTDAARLRDLVPYLVRMIALRGAFFALNATSLRRGETLDGMAAAALTLDAGGMLSEGNVPARMLLARADGLMLNRLGQLTARDPGAAKLLRQALGGPAVDALLRVPRDAGLSPYVVRLRPRREPSGWMVFISDPDLATDVRPEILAGALGLSAQASDLVKALMEGETVDEFCRRRGMSRNTVKYHLRSAFAATGTNRQADLVRHATAVTRDLAL